MTDQQLGVRCGNCGGNIYMVTCNDFRGSGHEWALVSVCMICRAVHWIESGCPDCHAATEPKRIVPLYDENLNPIDEGDDSA